MTAQCTLTHTCCTSSVLISACACLPHAHTNYTGRILNNRNSPSQTATAHAQPLT